MGALLWRDFFSAILIFMGNYCGCDDGVDVGVDDNDVNDHSKPSEKNINKHTHTQIHTLRRNGGSYSQSIRLKALVCGCESLTAD